MFGKIQMECREMESLKAAFGEKQYRYAAEIERRILEKQMIYFVEKSGHTLSGLTTFRAKCAETERLAALYGKNPDSLFNDIRAWQNEKDQLLFEGTRHIVEEEAFMEVAETGVKLIRRFAENTE